MNMPLDRSSKPLPHLDIDLRAWNTDDLPLMQAILGDPAMTEHLGGPESPGKLQGRLERYMQSSQDGETHMFVIVVGPDRVPAGSVGYWEREWQGHKVWETGWHVLPSYQRRGIATRATRRVLHLARLAHQHRFLHAFPSVENAASNAVCRKLRFSLQGGQDFEYPPGHWMRCNDWRLDLFAD